MRCRRSLIAAGALAAALAVGTAACSSGAAPHRPAPSPTAPAPRSPRPAAGPALPAGSPAVPAIPAVRRAGTTKSDWWLQPYTRIAVPAAQRGKLAQTAGLLAGDLAKLPHGRRPAVTTDAPRPGDIELALAGSVPGAPGGGESGAESYRMRTDRNTVRITAPGTAGVYYGTRTLVQELRARGTVPGGSVDDWPDRPERGLTVDIARKPETLQWLEQRVDELGNLKLNQLHLHFSDDQGFRIQSRTHPEVASPGALTQAQIKQLIAYASARHVTVVPEIDSPGHLGQVLKSHPDLALRGPGHAPPGAIDISKPAARKLVGDLVDEFAKLFPGKWFHLGGDEYAALFSSHPETAYPQVAAYARQRYGAGATVADAAAGWTDDLAARVEKLGRTPKAWNDGQPAHTKVKPDPNLSLEYWTGTEYGAREPLSYLKQHRSLLNMNDGYLYYVLGEPRQYTYPTGKKIYETWTPGMLRGNSAVPAQYSGRSLVPGARLGIWCDQASAQTPAEIASGIRMPLRALAERLWNPANPPGLSWGGFTDLGRRTLG